MPEIKIKRKYERYAIPRKPIDALKGLACGDLVLRCGCTRGLQLHVRYSLYTKLDEQYTQ